MSICYIVGAGEFYRIFIVAVAWLIIAVEEYLCLVYTAVQQTVDALSAGVMILTQLIDKVLLVDVVEVSITAAG